MLLPSPTEPTHSNIAPTLEQASNMNQGVYAQPQPQAQMSYGGAGGAGAGGVGKTKPGQWEQGLCGCKIGPFCLSFWCPCIGYGNNEQRLESLQGGRALEKSEIETCSSVCLIYTAIDCVTGLSCVMDVIQRSAVRKRYQISGNGCGDCCLTCLCLPCSQQQISRELAVEEAAVTQARAHQMGYGGPGGAQGVPVPVQSYSGGSGQVYSAASNEQGYPPSQPGYVQGHVQGQGPAQGQYDGGAKYGASGVPPSYRY